MHTSSEVVPYLDVLLLTGLAFIGALKAWIGLLVSLWYKEFGGHIIYAGTLLSVVSGLLAALLLWLS